VHSDEKRLYYTILAIAHAVSSTCASNNHACAPFAYNATHLGKQLFEIFKRLARAIAHDSQWGVIAHAAKCLSTRASHRQQQHLNRLASVPVVRQRTKHTLGDHSSKMQGLEGVWILAECVR
jgi:hypothetical protein